MRRRFFLAFLMMGAAPAAAQKESLGTYWSWGAFEENGRCWAISQPRGTARAREPFASVGFWPRSGERGQLHFRLSREKRAGSAVLLRIDERSFQLIGRGADAWPPDAHADADILAAMRRGVEMVVETRSTSGARVRDRYRLRGAASAIDAAAIACA